jgi:class 3 adenylate cyclase
VRIPARLRAEHTVRVVPEVRWAQAGDVALAYQLVGHGERDVVVLWAGATHLEVFWDLPENVDFVNRLADLGRIILYDKRGVGMSDRPTLRDASLDTYAEDLVAVLDAVGSSRAVLFSWLNEGATALAVAARHPDRIEAVVAGELLATFTPRPGHPWGYDPAVVEQLASLVEQGGWGEATYMTTLAPGLDARVLTWFKRLERLAASPSAAASMIRQMLRVDARPYLDGVRAPVLLLHDRRHHQVPEEGIRWLADQLPDARVRVVEDQRAPGIMPGERVLDEVEEFLTGERSSGGRGRELSVVLVVDVAGSTQTLADQGGDAWRHRLVSYRAVVRRSLSRLLGREIDTAGDGFLATFALPSKAIACAGEVLAATTAEGMHLRIGIHAGEVTVLDSGVTGMAVHVAARVCATAQPDQVLVTDTVALSLVGVTGAPVMEPIGRHELKGVPGRWLLRRALV